MEASGPKSISLWLELDTYCFVTLMCLHLGKIPGNIELKSVQNVCKVIIMFGTTSATICASQHDQVRCKPNCSARGLKFWP